MNIGDIVGYKNNIAVVMRTYPLLLALNTGETISCSLGDVNLLMNRSEVIRQFEDAIVKGGNNDYRQFSNR